MSKRKGNCNVMILRPVDHGLHIILLCEFNPHPTTWLIKFIFKPLLPPLWVLFFHIATTLFLSNQLDHQLVLAFSGAEVLYIAYEPKQFALIAGSQKLPPDQRLSNLRMVERERLLLILQKKATKRSYKWSGKEDGCLDTAWPDLWDINISFNYPPYYLMSSGNGEIVTLSSEFNNKA